MSNCDLWPAVFISKRWEFAEFSMLRAFSVFGRLGTCSKYSFSTMKTALNGQNSRKSRTTCACKHTHSCSVVCTLVHHTLRMRGVRAHVSKQKLVRTPASSNTRRHFWTYRVAVLITFSSLSAHLSERHRQASQTRVRKFMKARVSKITASRLTWSSDIYRTTHGVDPVFFLGKF